MHLLLKNKLSIGKSHIIVFNRSIISVHRVLFLRVVLLLPVVVFLPRKIIEITWARLLLLRNFFSNIIRILPILVHMCRWFKKYSCKYQGQSFEKPDFLRINDFFRWGGNLYLPNYGTYPKKYCIHL